MRAASARESKGILPRFQNVPHASGMPTEQANAIARPDAVGYSPRPLIPFAEDCNADCLANDFCLPRSPAGRRFNRLRRIAETPGPCATFARQMARRDDRL